MQLAGEVGGDDETDPVDRVVWLEYCVNQIGLINSLLVIRLLQTIIISSSSLIRGPRN